MRKLSLVDVVGHRIEVLSGKGTKIECVNEDLSGIGVSYSENPKVLVRNKSDESNWINADEIRIVGECSHCGQKCWLCGGATQVKGFGDNALHDCPVCKVLHNAPDCPDCKK